MFAPRLYLVLFFDFRVKKKKGKIRENNYIVHRKFIFQTTSNKIINFQYSEFEFSSIQFGEDTEKRQATVISTP